MSLSLAHGFSTVLWLAKAPELFLIQWWLFVGRVVGSFKYFSNEVITAYFFDLTNMSQHSVELFSFWFLFCLECLMVHILWVLWVLWVKKSESFSRYSLSEVYPLIPFCKQKHKQILNHLLALPKISLLALPKEQQKKHLRRTLFQHHPRSKNPFSCSIYVVLTKRSFMA